MHDLRPLGFRRATPDDLPWMMSLGYERYGPYDPGSLLLFAVQAMKAPHMLVLCHDAMAAFLAANYFSPPWWPKRRVCDVMMLCAREGAHWQAVKLLRESVAWAKLHHCVQWRFCSETTHDVGILCRRVGAKEDRSRYVIEWSN